MFFSFNKDKKKFGRRPVGQNYHSNCGNAARSRRTFKNRLSGIKSFVFRAFGIFMLIGIFYAILFTSIFEVKYIIIEGNQSVSSSEIKEAVLSVAGQKILKIFNNNLLFIQVSDIEKMIADRFSNITSVKVEKKFPQTVKVFISEKPADISWCNKIKIEKIASDKEKHREEFLASEAFQCYLSDENLIIYEKIDGAASKSVKVFRDEAIDIGVKMGDDGLKNFIRKLSGDFGRKTGLIFDYLYILPLASKELHLVTAGGWKIYFDLNRGVDEQLGVLNVFLKNELPSADDRKRIDYIDLRIPDRVYYKMK